MSKSKKTKKQPVRFKTQHQVDVTNRINDGRTKSFTTLTEAEAYAKKTNSYTYPLYSCEIVGGMETTPKAYGYAVPK